MTPLSLALAALIPEHGVARALARFARDALRAAGIGALAFLAFAALAPGREPVPATNGLYIALWWGVCFVAFRRLHDAGVRWLAQRSAGAA